jgi:3',5'-cyclic AMP phosphodiesterase CpdA
VSADVPHSGPAAARGAGGVRILHLTDLHLGARQLRAEDNKQHIAQAERRKLVALLGDFILAFDTPPDYVVISGDFTTAGDPEGCVEFINWVRPLIRRGNLPTPDRFLIAPGNHDVTRGAPDSHRFAPFFPLAMAFPHAWVPGVDPDLDHEAAPVPTEAAPIAGGVRRLDDELGQASLLSSYPYLVDAERKLMLFAFNSAMGCGVYPSESEELLDELSSLRRLATDGTEIAGKIDALLDTARSTLMLDAGLVGDDQLVFFQKVLTRLQRDLGDAFTAFTKIALLHHHVNPLWAQHLELKPYESVIDAAQLKQALTEWGFSLVLHGHKHVNRVTIDGSIVPVESASTYSPLCIVSGGTVCGNPALNDRQTLKLITLTDGPPYQKALIDEVFLASTWDPTKALATQHQVYDIRLPPGPVVSTVRGPSDIAREVEPGEARETGGPIVPRSVKRSSRKDQDPLQTLYEPVSKSTYVSLLSRALQENIREDEQGRL